MRIRIDVSALITLAALSCVPMTAQEKKTVAEKQEKKQAAPVTGGMKAYIDPATGKLREATPEDLQNEAVAAAAGGSRTAAPATLVHPSGAVSSVLGPEHMSFSVAKLNADGTLSMSCVEGEKKAQNWLKDFKKPVDLTLSKEKLDVK